MKNLFGEDILFLRTLNSIMFILVSSIPTLGNSVSFAGVSSQELQSTGNSTSGGVNYNSGESTITNPDGSIPSSTEDSTANTITNPDGSIPSSTEDSTANTED